MSNLLPDQIPPRQPQHDVKAPAIANFKIVSWPPLGQAHTVAAQDKYVEFRVLLVPTTSGPTEASDIEVVVWHCHDSLHNWHELQLKPSRESAITSLQHSEAPSHAFEGQLHGLPKHGHAVKFTVRYRHRGDEDWVWAKDITGIQDGELLYHKHDFLQHSQYDLTHWLDGLSSDIQVQLERAQTPHTLLYSLLCPIQAADGEESGWQHHRLGLPREALRWFSLVRLWTPWLAPRQGNGKLKLDKDAILLSFQRTDGLHVVMLGISGIDDIVTTFYNDSEGNVIIKGRNDQAEPGPSRVLVAVAQNFDVANAAVMYHARQIVSPMTNTASEEIETLTKEVKPEWMEEWYDGFAYCTWNGLGQALTEQKIFDALEDLHKEEIYITNLIIDDNWQSLSDGDVQFVRGWSAFEANKAGFPNGMKSTTSEIRRRFPNINHIAVWHALLGYWGGIDPNGEIAKTYKTIEVEKEPVSSHTATTSKFAVVAGEDAKRLYDDFYAFLSSVGVDAVKTDAQFFLDLIANAPDRRNLITAYQDAWSLAHLRHFSSRAISCMSQSPQMLFHSQLAINKPRLLVRNTDDFFPNIEASHPWHIFCNAHNALFAQHLNVIPDWDMFQTSHPWAGFHAAARCVSGGPIYFTDTPGEHDIALIHQMTGQTPAKKTIVLRPHTMGRAVDPYNEYDAQTLLKISTYVGFARTGTGILGVFNVTDMEIDELIPVTTFPGVVEDADYVIGSFTSGIFTSPLQSSAQQPFLIKSSLAKQGWDILSSYALKSFVMHSSPTPTKIAMLGLMGKMTGSAAVTGYDIDLEENGRLRIWTSLKALGMVGIYISDLDQRSVENSFMVTIWGEPISVKCVSRSTKSDKVLLIDIEKAWRDSGNTIGWSNELTFEVYMN